jgi:hypothetical protein
MVPLCEGTCSKDKLLNDVNSIPLKKHTTSETSKYNSKSGTLGAAIVNSPTTKVVSTVILFLPYLFTNLPPSRLPTVKQREMAIMKSVTRDVDAPNLVRMKDMPYNKLNCQAAIDNAYPTRHDAADRARANGWRSMLFLLRLTLLTPLTGR